jgi:uncharacterized membrane protein
VKELPALASVGIAAAVSDNTWTEACAETAAGRRFHGAGHVAKERLQKQASSTAAYDTT